MHVNYYYCFKEGNNCQKGEKKINLSSFFTERKHHKRKLQNKFSRHRFLSSQSDRTQQEDMIIQNGKNARCFSFDSRTSWLSDGTTRLFFFIFYFSFFFFFLPFSLFFYFYFYHKCRLEREKNKTKLSQTKLNYSHTLT